MENLAPELRNFFNDPGKGMFWIFHYAILGRLDLSMMRTDKLRRVYKP
jgi:hypothetical protein